MALEFFGGALVSAFLQVAADSVSARVVEFFKGRKLDEKLPKKLRFVLLSINAVADDAEEKQFRNPYVKAWLDEVKDAVFEAEDILDEIDTEVSKRKLEAEAQTGTGKKWNFFSASVSSLDKEIESKMKEVLDDLDRLASQTGILGLKAATGSGDGSGSQVPQRLPTTSLVDETVIYGRDAEKENIIDWLISHTENVNKLSIISVVGMGGIGKSTIAQLVYNDPRMEVEFCIKAWVCISDEFDVLKVTRTILEEVTRSTDDTRELNMLQEKLKEKLAGKKFLLVLDDVWNENPRQWEALQTPLNYGAQGSKILVTTRSEKVASAMRSNKIHHLVELREEHCWQLLAKHAFHDADPDLKPEFKEIGKRIVEKCKGLPLALKTIGSLLYTKSSALQWKSILTSEIWELPEEHSNIIPPLRLSYQHLPSHLKRCFAYCSLFPKDYKFDKENLILLWMAQNFLQYPQQSKGMEEVGEQYFNDLLSRSFFQQSSGNQTRFVMHDLLNDLAKYVSGAFCFRLEVEEAQSISKMARHFSYKRNSREVSKRFDPVFEATRLRTFLPINMHAHEEMGYHRLSRILICELFSQFSCIRVLSISAYSSVIELPDSIGNLKHLRYLELSHTSVKKLPDSTCLLYNLQTLKLVGCKDLEELPDSIGNLKHLRYLDLSGTTVKKLPDSTCLLHNLQTLKLRHCENLEELPLNLLQVTNLRHLDFSGAKVRKMPMHMGKLKNLQVLSSFYVGKGSDSNIHQLGELNLHGALAILELQNIVNPSEASAANLKNKEHLVMLHLGWSEDHDESQNERKVLENLQPSKLLKVLSIDNYGGTLFPDWFGGNSSSNVVSLQLRNCKYCVTLPPLGLLPSLKGLSIGGLDAIVEIGPEFYGNRSSNISFASLERLAFWDMKEWELWECTNVSGSFPRLRWLQISHCPKLKDRLPEQLLSLKKLDIFNCQQLVASAPWAPAIDAISLENCGNVQFDYHKSTLKSLYIGGRFMQGPLLERIWHAISDTCLEKLEIDDCPNMNIPISHCYHFLVALRIKSSCDSLRTFPLDLFPKLDTLFLEGCSNLETISFPQEHGSLTTLDIHRCPKFVSFPRGGFSVPKLEKLSISKLENLKSLPENMHILLPSLTDVDIKGCPQLESFFPREHGSLTTLQISSCPKFVSFPRGGFSAPKLEWLHISELENLKSLPENMHVLLPSLRDLHIRDCPQLQSFCDGGLPSSLEGLGLHNCSMLIASLKWALEITNSLHDLSIGDANMESFPDQELLPPTLTSLRIVECPNLKKLGYTGLCHLSSLRKLEIYDCPKLERLPEEGLPNSISTLEIRDCPLLSQRCQNPKGEDWGKIAHIQCVDIDCDIIT